MSGREIATKHLCIKVPPNMADGDHWCPIKVSEIKARPAVFVEWITEWAENAEVGDQESLELIEMTDAELEALPEM